MKLCPYYETGKIYGGGGCTLYECPSFLRECYIYQDYEGCKYYLEHVWNEAITINEDLYIDFK